MVFIDSRPNAIPIRFTVHSLALLFVFFCMISFSASVHAGGVRLIQDEQSFTVINTHGGLMFPRQGGGGLPIGFVFPDSKMVDRGFDWRDSLFNSQGGGSFRAVEDAQATAKVVRANSRMIVVESRASFVNETGQHAPGNPTVVYRWIFRADHPTIEIQANVQSDSDIYWPELHLFWLNRSDEYDLTRWVGKTHDIQTGEFARPVGGQHFSQWAVVEHQGCAIGMSFDQYPINLWDLASYHPAYMQYTDTLEQREFTLRGRLYIGSEQEVELYDVWLSPPVDVAAAQQKSRRADLTLANEQLCLVFDRETFTCIQIEDPKTGHMFLQQADNQGLLWQLDVQDAQGKTFSISNLTKSRRYFQWSSNRDELKFHWDNIVIQGKPSGIKVTATITLTPDADRAYWHLSVNNPSSIYSLMSARYPILPALSRAGRAHGVIPRSNWGKIERHLVETRGVYPSAEWPMQFIGVLDGANGLYLAYEDPYAYEKSFLLQPGRRFYFSTPIPNATVAGNDYEMPGVAAVGVSGPDWMRAAKMYREWAVEQPWTSDGPLRTNPSKSKAMQKIGLWINTATIHSPDYIREQIREMRDYFNVPLGVQYYFWHHGPMDELFPNYFPARPDMDAVMADMPEDVILTPYINARIYDQGIPEWEEDHVWAVRKSDGSFSNETYETPSIFAAMCPYTRKWQQIIQNIGYRLTHEHGIRGIYLDQLAASAPVPCFHPDHGHPLGGGGYWVTGYNRMLEKLREAAPESADVLLTTENNAEPYMKDIDGFLIWNPRHPDEIPLMTAVYSGYTIYFGSNAQSDDEPVSFAMIVGRDFLWGAQLGWMDFPQTARHRDFLRRLVQLRFDNLDYMLYGELVGKLQPTNDVGIAKGRWNNINFVDRSLTQVELPAAMGSIWKAEDGSLALFVVNFTDTPRQFMYEIDPAAYGLNTSPEMLFRLMDFDGVSAPTTREYTGQIIQGHFDLPPFHAQAMRIYSIDD